jgi:hypothetical protein
MREARVRRFVSALFSFFPIFLTLAIFLALLIKSLPLLSLKSLSTLIFFFLAAAESSIWSLDVHNWNALGNLYCLCPGCPRSSDDFYLYC